jgi:hypothetical protein
MEWETPEGIEISLACEVSGYGNAELAKPPCVGAGDVRSSRER